MIGCREEVRLWCWQDQSRGSWTRKTIGLPGEPGGGPALPGIRADRPWINGAETRRRLGTPPLPPRWATVSRCPTPGLGSDYTPTLGLFEVIFSLPLFQGMHSNIFLALSSGWMFKHLFLIFVIIAFLDQLYVKPKWSEGWFLERLLSAL